MTLGEDAQKLENAAKASDLDYLKDNHNKFIERFLRLKDELEEVLDKKPDDSISDSEKPMASLELINKAYEDFSKAASDKDIDRLEEVLADISKYNIPDEEKPLFNKIKESIDNFDYKTILEILNSRKTE